MEVPRHTFLSRLTICTSLLMFLHWVLFIGLIFRSLNRNVRQMVGLIGPTVPCVPVSESVWTC